jgi:hypothetical protein
LVSYTSQCFKETYHLVVSYKMANLAR